MSIRVLALAGALGAALAGAACTVGAPPGFSSGDTWAFPLVGPLEDGALLVPVTVNGKGPYLFLIDPDAPATSIDERLAKGLDLYPRMGPRLTGEADKSVPTRAAEVASLRIGTLTVTRPTVLVHDGGVYSAAGREVFGVLGRDIIAESLVFAFDRDAGMGYLATRGSFAAPEGSVRIKYEDVAPRVGLLGTDATTRRLVSAKVNGTAQTLHVDLGVYPSQLRPGRWKDAKLTPVPYRTTLVDEVAATRAIDKGGIANQVAVGDVGAMGVLMVAYDDHRTDPADIDGSLGLNFFAKYSLWADWSGRAIYLKPREDDADKVRTRLGRWEAPELAACKQPACVTASRVPSTGSAPPPPPPPVEGDDSGELAMPPVEIQVERDPSAKGLVYEVTLEAVDADGQPMGLPHLIATLPRDVTTVRDKVSPMFAEARFRVVDVSPFVRICRQPGGCVYELALAR